MMTCERFRELIPAAADATPEQLAHLRACVDCRLEAVQVDADYLFRALGGEDLVPDGGVDAFVEGVMSSIATRQTERATTSRSRMSAWQRWSIAAALALAVGSVLAVRTLESPLAPAATPVAAISPKIGVEPVAVIASYDAAGATIVELPAETSLEPKIVMVFDETLPVDL
jgi:hypothetical protein